MTVSEIISLSCDLSWVKSEVDYPTWHQISNAFLIKCLNLVKDNFWSAIINQSGESYFYEKWNINTVVGTTIYAIPSVTSSASGAKMIKDVYINYDNQTYPDGSKVYVKMKEVMLSNLKEDWWYYVNNQYKWDPIFYIEWDNINIAPKPTSSVTWWILVTGIKNIPNYTISTTEADMRIPVNQHEVLVQWLLPYIWQKQWDLVRAEKERAEFYRIKDIAIKNLSERVSKPFYSVIEDENDTY